MAAPNFDTQIPALKPPYIVEGKKICNDCHQVAVNYEHAEKYYTASTNRPITIFTAEDFAAKRVIIKTQVLKLPSHNCKNACTDPTKCKKPKDHKSITDKVTRATASIPDYSASITATIEEKEDKRKKKKKRKGKDNSEEIKCEIVLLPTYMSSITQGNQVHDQTKERNFFSKGGRIF